MVEKLSWVWKKSLLDPNSRPTCHVFQIVISCHDLHCNILWFKLLRVCICSVDSLSTFQNFFHHLGCLLPWILQIVLGCPFGDLTLLLCRSSWILHAMLGLADRAMKHLPFLQQRTSGSLLRPVCSQITTSSVRGAASSHNGERFVMIGDSRKNCRCMLQFSVRLLLKKASESNALCAMGQFVACFAAAVRMNHCIGRVLVSRNLKT